MAANSESMYAHNNIHDKIFTKFLFVFVLVFPVVLSSKHIDVERCSIVARYNHYS